MLLTADIFIHLYKQAKKTGSQIPNRETLENYDLSEEQWTNYVNFIDDLDLNEEGIRIVFDEIRNGHMKL